MSKAWILNTFKSQLETAKNNLICFLTNYQNQQQDIHICSFSDPNTLLNTICNLNKRFGTKRVQVINIIGKLDTNEYLLEVSDQFYFVAALVCKSAVENISKNCKECPLNKRGGNFCLDDSYPYL